MRLVLKRIFSRPYLLIGAILVVVLAVPVFQRRLDWVTVYLPAAEPLASGEDIFLRQSGFVYPPINAWLALAIPGAAARSPSLLLWHIVNMAALGDP